MPHDQLPNLIIAGVSRAGTTSLFWWLAQHPAICRSDVKEVRYYSAIRHGRPLGPIEHYAAHFAHRRGEPLALEASPAYAYGGRPVAEAIAGTLRDPRIIVSLRDPAERFVSFHTFMRSRLAIPPDMGLHSYLHRCQELARTGADRRRENFPYFALTTGAYADYLVDWIDVFGDRLRVVFFDDLVSAPLATLRALTRWMDVDTSVVEGFDLAVENRAVPIRNAALQRTALATNRRFGRFFGRHRTLKRSLRSLYHALNAERGTAPPPATTERDLALLRGLYADDNRRLGQLLRRHGYRDLPAWATHAPQPATTGPEGP